MEPEEEEEMDLASALLAWGEEIHDQSEIDRLFEELNEEEGDGE